VWPIGAEPTGVEPPRPRIEPTNEETGTMSRIIAITLSAAALAVVAPGLAAPLAAQSAAGYESGRAAAAPAAPAARNIVETAAAAGSFKTLAAALERAGLVEALAGKGPFTVFAPTDEAFAKVPKADLDALLADRERLKKVLLHHVVSGEVRAADLKAGADAEGLVNATTLAGTPLVIRLGDAGVRVGASASVVTPDVGASNGVIHVIDEVLIPSN
jgi:uncharacterized surface protein with fasciclin (FAS1) repeats